MEAKATQGLEAGMGGAKLEEGLALGVWGGQSLAFVQSGMPSVCWCRATVAANSRSATHVDGNACGSPGVGMGSALQGL